MNKIKKVGIIYSTSRKTDSVMSIAKDIMAKNGIKIAGSHSIKNLNTKSLSLLKNSDLILVLGGDGTMIGAIRKLHQLNTPFIGINTGRVGFLTDLSEENISSFEEVLNGNYFIEERSIFEAGFSDKNKDIFINEVVLHSGSVAKMFEIELSSNRQKIYKLRADGVIISSPTGSTAYSFSGGGPIISPKVDALLVMPMFSHSSSSNSLALPLNDRLDIKILDKKSNDRRNIVLDGKSSLRNTSKSLKVINTSKSFYLLHPNDYNYFHACRTKLGWASPI